MKRRITAILIIVCLAMTGSLSGLSERIVTGEDPAVYAASPPALKPINYKATGNQRTDVVGFARTQIGYAEKGNNNTYFGKWFGLNYNPWCAMFVCWCAAQAGVSTNVVPRIAAADRSWAKKQGVYYKSRHWGGSYKPQKGDLIYFSWSVRDYADHIGLVSGTGTSGGTTYVYTIEGNKHDKVVEGSYAINNKYILGYASPKYNNVIRTIRRGDPASVAVSVITAHGSEADLAGSTYDGVRLRSKKQSSSSINLSYSIPAGAASYLVFGSKCGAAKKYKLLTTTKNTKLTVKKISKSKLKKNTYYRFIVVALDRSGNVLSVSKAVHVATKGGTAGNPKKVTVIKPKKKVMTMTAGTTYQPVFKQFKPAVKKVKKHRKLKYESNNPNVATVSGKGLITAKAPGTCYVFAYSQNGRSDFIRITVK